MLVNEKALIDETGASLTVVLRLYGSVLQIFGQRFPVEWSAVAISERQRTDGRSIVVSLPPVLCLIFKRLEKT